MSDLLFEIFSEEIPARMQENAASALMSLVTDGLKKNGLTFESSAYYYTPRRLTVTVAGIPVRQESFVEEIKGPRVGSPEAAVQGFLRKNGLADLAQCVTKSVDGTDFYFAQKQVQGGDTVNMLGPILLGAIERMTWPKSMRWSSYDVRWARPFHNILALFGGDVVPGSFDFGAGYTLDFNQRTVGHRFLSDGKAFEVSSFADYQAKLMAAGVILDQKVRREKIWADVQDVAKAAGFTVKPDEKLLNEVTGLVEFPVPFMGTFSQDFLAIPAEVISTSMREHQRYFTVLDPSGAIVNHFICVANIRPDDGGKTIIYGNEKVLRARLSDARFFWDQDLKTKLADFLPRLQHIRFHEKLGTMSEKSERLKALAGHIAEAIGADVSLAERAAYLAKADLVTGMVREFPEIQGVMGGYYAKHSGENPIVAQAISSHYAPVGPSDMCATDRVAIAVALADKIDTLVGFFSINEKPTGSKDPFALRRAALGTIRLIVESKLDIDLQAVIKASSELYGVAAPADLRDFIIDRLRVVMIDQGVPHKVVGAVFEVQRGLDLYPLSCKVRAVADYLLSENGQKLSAILKRVVNILGAAPKAERAAATNVDVAQLTVDEQVLYRQLAEARASYDAALSAGEYINALESLTAVYPSMWAFFENSMIMDSDAAKRQSKLALVNTYYGLFAQLAVPESLQ